MRALLKSLALSVPAIQRLAAHRDDLLAEVASLREQILTAKTAPAPAPARADGEQGVLDLYTKAPPDRRNGLELFAGAWSSEIPGYGFGASKLFEDHRVAWWSERLGGFTGKRVLELGPLEGGHTFMMSRGGAASITAIESNSRAFLKCLLVQNALGFGADFMFGDFQPYLASTEDRFDFALASGVLYHMDDPVSVLVNMAKVAPALGIWTHYYDAKVIGARPDLARKFNTTPEIKEVGGRRVELYRQSYLEALGWSGFCGGAAPTSTWLTREGLIGVLEDLGYTIEIGADEDHHPNGSCMTLFAKRS